MSYDDLVKDDLAHIFHPCTQMKDHEYLPLVPISRGEGVYLYSPDGSSYIDCVSSWWVNIFGHANPYISKALADQAFKLEHVLLAGFTHPGIVKFSKRLCALQDESLSKCFYADNGSAAVEVALKMSFHKAYLQGKEKKYFLSLSNSYHGETIAALSVSDVGLYKKSYEPLLLQCLHTSVPKNADYEKELNELKAILDKHAGKICAFILEPLLQCAGNMHMYAKSYVKDAVKLARSYDVDIIFDEIAVGFGRTGSMFAYEQCEVVPDFLCLSKAITAGYLPLSVVLTTDDIYEVFYAPYEEGKSFLHSHSYTGSALAIACANATLDIFEQEDVISKNKDLSSYINSKLEALKAYKNVTNIRSCGMVFAFDLLSKQPRSGLAFYQRALKEGLLLRPLGNTIYFMPPYVINLQEIDFVFEGIENILANFA